MSRDSLLFTFFNEIGIIDQLASNKFERALPDGLTLSQFSVLNHFVRLGDGRSPLELANAFQVTKGAMTNTLSKLGAKGFVALAPNPDDGRGKIVKLTQKGRGARARALKAMTPVFEDASAKLPKNEIEKLLPILQNVRAILDEDRD